MKKIILMLMVVSAIFVSCAPTEVKLSPGKADIEATFTDFFDPVELVHASSDNMSTAIVMDKNTGVLYVRDHPTHRSLLELIPAKAKRTKILKDFKKGYFKGLVDIRIVKVTLKLGNEVEKEWPKSILTGEN